MSAHDILDWIFGRKSEHQDSGWQRESPQQDTGGYQLPDLLTGIAGGPRWAGPTGTWSDVYRGETPHRRREPETGRLRQLPPGLDRRDWSDIDTVKHLPMRDLLAIRLPNDALPVRKPVTDRPNSGQIPANNWTSARDELHFADLPTWLAPETIQERISAALPPLPDGGAWLNSEPLRLTPLPEQSIAATDRTATSAFVLSDEECAPDLSGEDATMAQQDRALYQLRLMARKQESEG